MSWTTAILHLFSQETDLLMKVIMKCVNIKLLDILGCFTFFLKLSSFIQFFFPNTFCTVALRRNPPARNPREGVLQYIKKERKKVFITY